MADPSFVAITFATQGQKPVAFSVPAGTTFVQDGKETVIKKTDKPIVFNMDEAHYKEALKLDYNKDGKLDSADTASVFGAQKKPYGAFPGEHESKYFSVTPKTYMRDVTPENQKDNKRVGFLLPGYQEYNNTHAAD